MMDSQKFCLKWDGFQSSVTSMFDHLRRDGELVDITLCCEGQRVKAHRMMLSACSPYFRDLLKNNSCQQMVIFLKDTSAQDLSAVIEFMYKGSVNVSQTQLGSFLKTAEMLQIRGLSGEDEKPSPPPQSAPRRAPTGRPRSPPSKRARTTALPATTDSGPPLPPPPPPPPPAAVAGAGAGGASPPECVSDLSAPSPLTSPEGRAEVTGAERAAGVDGVKVEKVDLSDEDTSLDATIGYVADYEASSRSGPVSGGGGARESVDHLGSLAALQDGRMARDTAAAAAAVMALAAGPSAQRLQPYCLNSQGAVKKKIYPCDICGKVYHYRDSVYRHKRTHEGLTGCYVCGKVLSCLATLREHLRFQHGMSQTEVAGAVSAASASSAAAAAALAMPPMTSAVQLVTSLGSLGAGNSGLGRVNNTTVTAAAAVPLKATTQASSSSSTTLTMALDWEETASTAGEAVPGSVPPPRSAE